MGVALVRVVSGFFLIKRIYSMDSFDKVFIWFFLFTGGCDGSGDCGGSGGCAAVASAAASGSCGGCGGECCGAGGDHLPASVLRMLLLVLRSCF